jgi:hypothetical protein
VEAWLSNAKAMVQVEGGWPVDSWVLWCRVVVGVMEGAGNIGYFVVMVADDEGCG